MSTRTNNAIDCFKEGFSCSQAVLAAFSGQQGLSRDTALKLADGFGGGMGRLGMTCGAVTGAMLVIGLQCGRAEAGDHAAKQKTVTLVRRFVRDFTASHGSITCHDLLGCDLGTDAGFAFAHDHQLISKHCPVFIADAVELLESLLAEE